MLIHTYYYGDGGLGDTIRSIYAYFIYCLQNDIPYYFYVMDGHPLEQCFEKQEIPQVFSRPIYLIDNGSSVNKNTLNILNLIKQKDKNFVLRSNVFEFMPFEQLALYKKEFLEFLKISPLVKDRMKQLLEGALITGSFVSIHARCGDKFMKNVNIGCDARIGDPFSKDIENKFMLFVEYFKKNFENRDIIFFSDNVQLKQKMKNMFSIKLLDSVVHHTAMNTNDKVSGTIDAVAEFFIMASSDGIGIISKSGIPYWSSYLFDKPLYYVSNHASDVSKHVSDVTNDVSDNEVKEYDKVEYFLEYHRQ